MNEIFNQILTNTSNEITVASTLITMLTAIVLGLVISITYKRTQDGFTDRDFLLTLVMLPVILAVIIIFVGSNIARAFSLAGTLSIIRFRSAPGSAKDIGYIFFSIAAGLACGVGLYGYGAAFTAILCLVMFLLEKAKFGIPRNTSKLLKITVPENLNYQNAFDGTLREYTVKYRLIKTKTCDLGSLFELTYNIEITDGTDEHKLIDEIRIKNSNLNIVLTSI